MGSSLELIEVSFFFKLTADQVLDFDLDRRLTSALLIVRINNLGAPRLGLAKSMY